MREVGFGEESNLCFCFCFLLPLFFILKFGFLKSSYSLDLLPRLDVDG